MTGIGTQIKNALSWFKNNLVNNWLIKSCVADPSDQSTVENKALSAWQGKLLQDQINSLNTKIGNRIVISRYFAGTYNNTSYAFVSLSDMGITGKKLHQFPSIFATLNTDVSGMYIEKAFRNSDESITIIFNKAYNGSFIIALSFDVVDV